jgi:oligopeptide/dipeptide ABC transporter ATP-binding protein
MSSPNLLELHDVVVEFERGGRTLRAVDQVSLDLAPERTLAIVGESGSGKTAAASAILRLIRPPGRIAGGQIVFDGQDLLRCSSRQLRQIRGHAIGMIFQDPMTALNPTLTIGYQIAEPLRKHLGLSKQQARRRAIELLESVRIERAHERYQEYPHRLSGGMRQRVMIAIAVACNPRLLIADEPTTALDVTVQAEVLDIMRDLRKEHGLAMIIITHDMGVVADIADQVAVMYAGQIVERAPVDELFDSPEHPYTEALLEAVPVVEDEGIRHVRLRTIPGQPPDLTSPPPACRFAPRCRHAHLDDSCATTPPPLREIRENHWVRSAHPRSER